MILSCQSFMYSLLRMKVNRFFEQYLSETLRF